MNPTDFFARGAWLLVWLCCALPVSAQSNAPTPDELECGVLHRPDFMAPMDYRTDRRLLSNVEFNHFAPNVEHLIKPMFQYFGSDISYTLHAFPNHPRALMTLTRLGEREKTEQPKGLPYPIDCFFRRALRFRPDDAVVRMIYAQYMIKKGRTKDASTQLDYVVSVAGENQMTYMNAGLLFLEMKDYDKAASQQQRLEELGFDQQELRRKLVESGKWPRPGVPARAASAPPAPAASQVAGQKAD